MNPNILKRIALVGLGSIGRRHLRLLKTLRPEIEVILVRSGYGETWPEEIFATESVSKVEHAIAKSIDAAIISSPAPYHLPQAFQFLDSGIPLLIEKPLSHSLENIQEFQDLASKTRIPVLVGYVLRYSSDLRAFQELLMKLPVGQLIGASIYCSSYLPNWRPDQDYRMSASGRLELGGGVLLELSHELDYAIWLFGPFLCVEAKLQNSGLLDIEVEDIADIVIIAKTGIRITIHLDFCTQEITRLCAIECSEGNLIWDGVACSINLDHNLREKIAWSLYVERDVMFTEQLKHFLSCVEEGASPIVSLNDGVAVISLIEALRLSNREGRVVYL